MSSCDPLMFCGALIGCIGALESDNYANIETSFQVRLHAILHFQISIVHFLMTSLETLVTWSMMGISQGKDFFQGGTPQFFPGLEAQDYLLSISLYEHRLGLIRMFFAWQCKLKATFSSIGLCDFCGHKYDQNQLV